MPCEYQLQAQAYGFTPTGKVNYIFPNNSNYKHHLPPDKKFNCGQCLPDRLEKSLEWSIRMMHEAQMHPHNIFLTLTQNPESMPPDRNLNHVDFQKFMKRMRKHYGPMRFLMCGELGENRTNPHYHAVIFGLEVNDLILFTKNQRGDAVYTSPTIEKIWGRGFITIGEVNKTTCSYTAGYLLKDAGITHEKNREYVDNQTGEILIRKKPYISMSTKPGIGKDWYDKFKTDVFPHDYCIYKGKKVATPNYYRKQLEKANPELFELLREKREAVIHTDSFRENNTPKRIATRAKIKTLNLKRLQLEKTL